MTAKEKAKQMFNKFRPLAYHDQREIGSYQLMQEMHNAKKCALILVDEILENNEIILHPDECYLYSLHWKEVKQEINKL
jgi:hypothetical protein